jgi:hypothetical protein
MVKEKTAGVRITAEKGSRNILSSISRFSTCPVSVTRI